MAAGAPWGGAQSAAAPAHSEAGGGGGGGVCVGVGTGGVWLGFGALEESGGGGGGCSGDGRLESAHADEDALEGGGGPIRSGKRSVHVRAHPYGSAQRVAPSMARGGSRGDTDGRVEGAAPLPPLPGFGAAEGGDDACRPFANAFPGLSARSSSLSSLAALQRSITKEHFRAVLK
eukprot:TRINITY_DN3009_c0_g1_i1.p3 TRINITY_DN3009_c0_g1~~TRINITY_DN3009_c0_g1_i1.p3  ORF type:complete len:187 (-),score=51.91 TRINITY_DN3009_c0_g1_i1:245-769(-)